MTQVTVKTTPEQNALNQLTDIQRYYVSLKSDKPLSQLPEPNIKRLCVEVITRSMVESSPNGQSDPQIIQAQSNFLFNELKGKLLSLTPSEVKEAFRLGVRGETGPYFGMCPKTYAQFLKHWFERSERGKAWDCYLDKLNGWTRAEKPSLPPEWFYEACEKAYTKYKETGKLPISPFGYYDFIKDYLGVDTLMDGEQWPLILSEAKEAYKAKIKGLDIAKEWKLNTEENLVFANSIKDVAVKRFFDNLILQGKEKIK